MARGNPNPKTEYLKPNRSPWLCGKTKTIRVPIAIAEEVLEYAIKLDWEKANQIDRSI